MKIAVLISGGVDSSVALRLLRDQGHEITAFYLKIWLEDELSFLGDCPWEEDLSYVRAVCEQAQVSLEIVSLQKEYHDTVVAYVVQEVRRGRTPNPDVLCNRYVKFGFFIDWLDATHPGEFDLIASGHYARIDRAGNQVNLCTVPDPVKDQTYFLAYLTKKQLVRLVFPLSHYTKIEVRELAQRYDLPNKDRKDSQGICFLGKLKFSDFIKQYVGERDGDLVEYETGKVVGKHKGFWFYTIGQRQGIGLAGGPWYVVAKDTAHNQVFISRNYYDESKERQEFLVTDLNLLRDDALPQSDLFVKIRHGAHMHRCTAVRCDNGSYRITLDQRDQGIASGQFAVFYHNDVCLGAGIIDQDAIG